MTDTHILLTPHALTQWNLDGRRQGHLDVPINDAGRAMAERLAERLASHSLDAVYASDLRRAWETAAPVAERHGLAVRRDPRLRECRWHDGIEGGDAWPLLPFPVATEDREAVVSRVSAAMNAIAATHPGETVLVVSHGAATLWFLGNLLKAAGRRISEYRRIRTALNHLYVRDGAWRVGELNDDAHVSERGDDARADAG